MLPKSVRAPKPRRSPDSRRLVIGIFRSRLAQTRSTMRSRLKPTEQRESGLVHRFPDAAHDVVDVAPAGPGDFRYPSPTRPVSLIEPDTGPPRRDAMSTATSQLAEPHDDQNTEFDQAEATACCNASDLAACCDTKDKAACCGTPAAGPAPDEPPSRCGCR
jgi:hypothetical protein